MKPMKRLALAIAVCALALAFAPAVAFADEVVTVASTDDLVALSQRVAEGDSMAGVTVVQEADIDFEGTKGWFVPIGTRSTPFEGTYDGQGHAISNMSVYRLVIGVETTYLGVFGYARGATFRNVVTRDLNVWINSTSRAYEALLCPIMESCAVENCDIQGAVGAESGSSYLTMGGLCANATDCTISDTKVVYARGVKDRDQFSPSYPSAILVRTATRCAIKNCDVVGSIIGAGSTNSGGLVGTMVDSSIDFCTADAPITGSVSSANHAGGLVGYAENSTISNSANKGAIACTGGNESGSVGGLVGYLGKGSKLENCANSAEVSMVVTVNTYDGGKTSSSYAGGLVGTLAGNSSVSGCVNAGAVKSSVSGLRHAYCRAGGLVGNGSLSSIADSYNCADVDITAETTQEGWPDSKCVVGGIAANLEDVEVSNCYNIGKLSYQYITPSEHEPLVDGICPSGNASFAGCCYYRCACDNASEHGGALTAIDMMKPETYAIWDFENVWAMDEQNYLLPVLKWETEPRAAVIEPETVVEKLTIDPIADKVYKGQPIEPKIVVKADGKKLSKGTDYKVVFSKNVKAGTAKVNVECWGGYIGGGKATFKIAKAPNPMKVKASKKTFKKNKKKAQTAKLTVSNAKGKVTFSSSNKKVKVTSRGKVTIAKGFKGTVRLTVKAAGTANYEKARKAITIQVR